MMYIPTHNPQKNISHYIKTISLCLLVAALCGSALAQDCVTLFEDVFCVENFSHERLTRAIELIELVPKENLTTEMQIQISLSKEQLIRLMQWTEGDVRVEVKMALKKLKDNETQKFILNLNDANMDNAFGMYWSLQLVYENDLIMKRMFSFFYKCAHDPKVLEAYNNFHNKNAFLNAEGTLQSNRLPVEEYKAKSIEIIESLM